VVEGPLQCPFFHPSDSECCFSWIDRSSKVIQGSNFKSCWIGFKLVGMAPEHRGIISTIKGYPRSKVIWGQRSSEVQGHSGDQILEVAQSASNLVNDTWTSGDYAKKIIKGYPRLKAIWGQRSFMSQGARLASNWRKDTFNTGRMCQQLIWGHLRSKVKHCEKI
jgi:hypothetical protein